MLTLIGFFAINVWYIIWDGLKTLKIIKRGATLLVLIEIIVLSIVGFVFCGVLLASLITMDSLFVSAAIVLFLLFLAMINGVLTKIS